MRTRSAFRAVLGILLWGPALAACVATPFSAPSAARSCRVSVADSLSLRPVRNHPVVTVSVNGEPVSMLLDTGAETSTVTRATAARLRLPAEPGGADLVTGLDGTRLQPVVRATLALSGRGRVSRVPVVDLPPDMEGIAGVVGVDVLSDYELDLDQPGGRLTLLRAENCAAGDPPVPDSPSPAGSRPGRSWHLPAAFTPQGRVLVPVEIGGVAVQAMLDTGVERSVLAPGTARRAGLTDAQIGAGTPSSFLGPALQPLTMREVLLPDVRIGPDRLPSLPVDVPDANLPGLTMLLGNDYLSRRRLLISWQRRTVFVRTGN